MLQSKDNYLYGLEQLLYQYGVDLWLNGHEHNYERMYDIEPKEIYTYLSGETTQSTVNPPGTVYIVTGDGGNYKNHAGDGKYGNDISIINTIPRIVLREINSAAASLNLY